MLLEIDQMKRHKEDINFANEELLESKKDLKEKFQSTE